MTGRYLFLGAGNPGGLITESRRDGKESRRDSRNSRRDGKESRRGHNGIPEGYNTKHNRTQLIAERLS